MRRAILTIGAAVVLAAPAARAGRLSIPKDYTPETSWPVVVATQSNPDPEVMKQTPYFLVHAGGKGVECSNKIRDYLKTLASRFNIDPLRIYATSFSRGGHEILRQAVLYPDRFAAIAPVDHDLRRGKFLEYVKLMRTPVLQLHGDHDSFRKTGRALFEQMKAAGVPITWATFPGGHNPRPVWNTKLNRVWLDFFARHKLDPYPKEIVHLVDHKRYSRAFWVDSTLVEDAGGMAAVFKVRVKDGNRIEVEADEKFAGLDLYLTDKLVDTTKPVTVVTGAGADEKELYKGPVAEKITIKLREAKPYYQTRTRPLWEELEAIRQKSKWMAALKKAGKTSRPVKVETGKGYDAPAKKPETKQDRPKGAEPGKVPAAGDSKKDPRKPSIRAHRQGG